MTIFPIIHLNGTPKSHLFDGYVRALHSVDEAIKSYYATAPHERDYYVSDDKDAYAKARIQYLNGLTMLEQVRRQLEELAKHTKS